MNILHSRAGPAKLGGLVYRFGVRFSRDIYEQQKPRPSVSDPIRHADGDGGYRHLDSRVPMAGVAARRQRAGRVDRGRGHDAATGALHAGRRYRGRLFRASPGFARLRFAVRHSGGRHPVDRLVVRSGCDQPGGASRPGGAGGRFRPGRDDGSPVDAARGRRPRGLVAGPHQQHLRGDSQPGVHCGPGHRRFDDRHGWRHQHDVDHRGSIRVVHPRNRRRCGSRAPASRTTRPDPTGWCPASPRGCDLSGTCGCYGRSG